MSGLIDAVETAVRRAISEYNEDDFGDEPLWTVIAPAAVLAVADWLDGQTAWRSRMAGVLRAEVAPPPPPTAEDVIREAYPKWQALAFHSDTPAPPFQDFIAAALRDAGLLREATP